MARYLARLSANALKHLVAQDPVPHTLFDLRTTSQRGSDPLPQGFEQVAVTCSMTDLAKSLKDTAAWQETFPKGPPYPSSEHLLVFITKVQQDAELAASHAVKHNFQRCLHVSDDLATADPDALQLTYINRDAVAHLLDLASSGTISDAPFFVDLRRHDERSLYGAIRGTVHVPTEVWPYAISAEPADFEKITHVAPPDKRQLMVLQCRSNRRAGWAARLALEEGYKKVLVYKQGSYGWRLDPEVKAYPSYEAGDALPDDEPFEPESIDKDAAALELQQLGIL